MKLIFKGSEIPERGRGLDYDDVLMVPQYSAVSSRKDTNLEAAVTKKHRLSLPFISADMDTVTDQKMACAMALLGGLGILHRFMPVEEQVRQLKAVRSFMEENHLKGPVAAACGVKGEGLPRASQLASAGVDIVAVDIAHGDSALLLDTVAQVKKAHPHVAVMAGNTATEEGTRRMIEAGASAVKVGIGPGSVCTTRLATGHGVPQLSALSLCAREAAKHAIPLVADGGIASSGDMMKAFGAGASTVMLGRLLAGTDESPGEEKDGMKEYRGMASEAAQISWKGGLPKGMAPEGVSTLIPQKGPVALVIEKAAGGIRSGISYVGVDRLSAVASKALFMEVAPRAFREGRKG